MYSRTLNSTNYTTKSVGQHLYENTSSPYRYGMNGMEKDDEIKGEGNSYTTDFRQYDPRIGRWLSLDPMMAKYASQSPYAAFNNNPIYFKDPMGLEGEPPVGESCVDENNEIRVFMGDGQWGTPKEFTTWLEGRIAENDAQIAKCQDMKTYIQNRISENNSILKKDKSIKSKINVLNQELLSLENELNTVLSNQEKTRNQLTSVMLISEIIMNGSVESTDYNELSSLLGAMSNGTGFLAIGQGAIEHLGGEKVVAKLIQQKQFTAVWNGQAKSWSINFMGNKSVSAEFVAAAKTSSAQLKALNIIKAGGVMLSVGGGVISIMQYANGDIGEVELTGDLFFTGVAIYGGPIGWVASSAYFLTKATQGMNAKLIEDCPLGAALRGSGYGL